MNRSQAYGNATATRCHKAIGNHHPHPTIIGSGQTSIRRSVRTGRPGALARPAYPPNRKSEPRWAPPARLLRTTRSSADPCSLSRKATLSSASGWTAGRGPKDAVWRTFDGRERAAFEGLKECGGVHAGGRWRDRVADVIGSHSRRRWSAAGRGVRV